MPRRKSKKRSLPPTTTTTTTKTFHDLNVPLPPSSIGTSASEKNQTKTATNALIQRLHNIGYSTIALSHTVYGRTDLKRDDADFVLPKELYQQQQQQQQQQLDDCVVVDNTKPPNKKQKQNQIKNKIPKRNTKVVLRRLNAIIEDLSDISHYCTSTSSSTTALFSKYDLISLTPKNDAAFSAACTTPSLQHADILHIDYYSAGGNRGVPYRIKASDVKEATKNKKAFELCYGPAIVDPTKRRALIQAAVELRSAALSVRNPAPTIFVSSGSRKGAASGCNAADDDDHDNDLGGMVLRYPNDVLNILQTVLGFEDNDALGLIAASVVQRGYCRKIYGVVAAGADILNRGKEDGGVDRVDVFVEEDDSLLLQEEEEEKEEGIENELVHYGSSSFNKKQEHEGVEQKSKSLAAFKSNKDDAASDNYNDDDNDDDEVEEDGFITL